jgi:hypothetical protein
MAEGDGGAKTFTQEEVDALIAQENAGLAANRDTLLGEVKAAKKALAAFEGVDPAEFNRLKTAAEEAEREQAAAEGDWTKLEEKMKEAHAAELAGKDKRIGKLMGAINKHLVDAELTKALVAAKGDAALLLPHARKFVQTRETDDGFEVFVADEKGTPLVSDGQGTPMTMTQLIEGKIAEQFPRAFEGTGSSGGGASKSIPSGGGHTRTIAADDKESFMANIEDIAAGKTLVQ